VQLYNIYGTNTATGFALPLTATVDCPVDPALTKTETGLDPALTFTGPTSECFFGSSNQKNSFRFSKSLFIVDLSNIRPFLLIIK